MKKLLRSALRPILRPIWHRVWVRIERRVASVEAQLTPHESRLATLEGAWRQHVPAFLNAISSVDAFAHQMVRQAEQTKAMLEALEARIDQAGSQVEAQLAPHESRLVALEGAWRQHVPAFLNAISSVGAFAHQMVRQAEQTKAMLEALEARIDQASSQIDNEKASIKATLEGLEVRIDQASSQIDNEKASIKATLEGLEARIDQASFRIDNDVASIRALWERLEFMRREIMFEMAHGGGRAAQEAAPKAAARILDIGKVAAARAAGTLRLNLGCGHIALPDHLNVDARELPGVDVVADAGDLPFEPKSVEAITSAHLLEHFPQEELRRRLLPHWFSLLRPGGRFSAVTPDAAAMLAAAGAGTYAFEDFREVLFGAQDYVGDYHYNLLTPGSLQVLLEEAGFRDITVPVTGRQNGKCFEFEITARRP
jgi:SAM-dependent methyltransferase